MTSPELGVGQGDVFIEGAQVGAVPVEVLVCGGVLQDTGDGAEDAALLGQEGGARRELHHVEAVGRHHRRVHVAVVHQVPHNLTNEMRASNKPGHNLDHLSMITHTFAIMSTTL